MTLLKYFRMIAWIVLGVVLLVATSFVLSVLFKFAVIMTLLALAYYWFHKASEHRHQRKRDNRW